MPLLTLLNLKARKWHTWAGILLALPMLIVGMTALFIAHKKSLGTEAVRVDAGWLPGYRTAHGGPAPVEARAVLVTHDGRTLIATQDGLFRMQEGRPVPVNEFIGVPVRALAEAAFGKIAAAKNGLWLERGGIWERTMPGDAWNVSRQDDGSVVAALKERGLLISRDGRHWETEAQLANALAAIGSEQKEKALTLNKLIMDLHTGQAFFGKSGEWLWVDLVGLSLCLLTLTGVKMWWRTKRRKPKPSNSVQR